MRFKMLMKLQDADEKEREETFVHGTGETAMRLTSS